MKTYSERLTYALERAGINQKELSLKSGVQQQNISHLCNGGEKSSYTAQIAKVLGVDAYWLATGNGEPYQQISSNGQGFLSNVKIPKNREKTISDFCNLLSSESIDPIDVIAIQRMVETFANKYQNTHSETELTV